MRSPARLEQLTGLRFFAALFVLLSHLEFLKAADSPVRGLASTVFHEGYCGVTFFYVLSGFILSHTYGESLTAGTITRGRYLLLRVVRIFPLHLAIAIPLAVIALWRSGLEVLPTIALNLTLLQSWSSNLATHFSLNGVSWSLSDELFFYAAFILLVRFDSRTLLALCAVWAAAAIGYAAYLGPNPSPEAGHWALYVLPATRLLDFMAGMLLHRLFRLRASTDGNLALWTCFEVAAVGALLAAMYAYPHFGLPQTWRYELAYLPIMVAVLYVFTFGRGLLSRGLATKGLVFLGNASFALYMIHQPIAFRLANYGAKLIHDPLALAAVTILVCVGASAVVFRYLEKPVHRALKEKVGRRAFDLQWKACQLRASSRAGCRRPYTAGSSKVAPCRAREQLPP